MCNGVVQSERSSLIGCSYCLATVTEVQSDAQPERSKEQTLDHIIHTCVTGALWVCVFHFMSVHLTEKEWKSPGFSWIMVESWQGLGRRQVSRPCGILCRTTLHKLLG